MPRCSIARCDSAGLLSYANAGHCAPFLLGRDSRLRKLHTTGMPVGMIEDAVVQMVEAQLSPGDRVVIYSDGVTETENAEGEFFGTERLRACLREHVAGWRRRAACRDSGGSRTLRRRRCGARRHDAAGLGIRATGVNSKTVLYTAAHGGYAGQAVPLGGGAAVCEHLVEEWSRTRPFPFRLISSGHPGIRRAVGRWPGAIRRARLRRILARF